MNKHVSIHAPAWGATCVVPTTHHILHPVSIHAPAWGATLALEIPSGYWGGFNPRTRVGCDTDTRI